MAAPDCGSLKSSLTEFSRVWAYNPILNSAQEDVQLSPRRILQPTADQLLVLSIYRRPCVLRGAVEY